MDESEVQPPVVKYGRGYSIAYAIYLHSISGILRNVVSYVTGPFDGFHKDILIDTPGLGGGKVRSFICIPTNEATKLKATRPLILVFEGGGFVLGEPKDGGRHDQRLANETGSIVISVDYAKSPRYEFPHALLQIYAVLRWAVSKDAEAEGLMIDASRVAFMGNSAGGNLAASLSLLVSFASGPCARFRERLGPKFRQVLQVLLYPSVELQHSYASRMERATAEVKAKSLPVWAAGMMEDAYLPPYINRNQIFTAPLTVEVGLLRKLKVSPALIITAGLDCLKDEANAYAEKLREAGHTVNSKEYPLAIHGFTHYKEGNKDYRKEDVEGSWKDVSNSLKEAFETI